MPLLGLECEVGPVPGLHVPAAKVNAYPLIPVGKAEVPLSPAAHASRTLAEQPDAFTPPTFGGGESRDSPDAHALR
jgi:hypothetical protein